MKGREVFYANNNEKTRHPYPCIVLKGMILDLPKRKTINFGGKLSFILYFLLPERLHCCYIYFHCSYLYNYYS